MRRFFIPAHELNNDEILLEGDEFHHLKNVSRLEEGENVELLDGAGHLAKATIMTLAKKSATLKILSRKTLPPPPQPLIHIVLCVPRFQKMDFIIQKAVELNAHKITVVTSDRSFLKTVSKELTAKLPRWKKIADEACKQSGRAWPLAWGEIKTLREELDRQKDSEKLFMYEGEAATDIKTALQKFKNPPEKLSVFVGAEGGFSPDEVQLFESAGLKPVSLGPLVLRVETACIALISVIEYEFGHLR